MTLEQFHQISEIIAAVVVAITLIFLTVQLRQNTKMLRSAATQGAHDQISDIYQPLMADESLADIWLRGNQDPSKLSAVDTARYFSFWIQTMFDVQNWYFQTREGLLDETILNSFCQVIANLHKSSPGFVTFWERRKYVYAPDFIRYIEADVFTKEMTPGYQPLGLPEESSSLS